MVAPEMRPRANGAEWQVDADPSWPGFAGHFPGNPLVPAAEMLAWALDIAGKRGFTGTSISKARFLAPVRPGESLRLSAANNGNSFVVAIARGDTAVAEITIS